MSSFCCIVDDNWPGVQLVCVCSCEAQRRMAAVCGWGVYSISH